MKKVLLSVSINDSISKYEGLFDKKDEIIEYIDSDEYLNKLYVKESILKRTKDNIQFIMYINDNPYIEYNTEYGKIDIPINVFYFKKNSKLFHLKYSIENEIFEYIVNIEKFVEKNVDFVSK